MRASKCQRGQTSVEYILLIAAMIFISIAFFKEVQRYMITNPDSFLNRYIGEGGVFSSAFNANGRYKRFRLSR